MIYTQLTQEHRFQIDVQIKEKCFLVKKCTRAYLVNSSYDILR
jgi:hypothetical protein